MEIDCKLWNENYTKRNGLRKEKISIAEPLKVEIKKTRAIFIGIKSKMSK